MSVQKSLRETYLLLSFSSPGWSAIGFVWRFCPFAKFRTEWQLEWQVETESRWENELATCNV